MMPARRLLCVLTLLCIAACGPSSGGPHDEVTLDGGKSRDGGTTPIDLRRVTALEVQPASLMLKTGNAANLTATATFSDGTQADVSGSVQWTASSPVVRVAILSASDNLVRVDAVGAGAAEVTAKVGSVVSNPSEVTATNGTDVDGGYAAPEVRAVWVTRFEYNTPAHVKDRIARAANAGFNTVYFQIRGNGDAYYKSRLAPWAEKLTGTLGKDPLWDPLQLAIDEAHARGMKLHAYWNVFSAWPCKAAGSACNCNPIQGQADSCVLPPESPAGQPNHILRAHPEYMAVNEQGNTADSEYFYLSPGNPAVREHLVAVASELLTQYAVDGLHLDRVRYAGRAYSYDAASRAAFAARADPAQSRDDWQRAQVTETVSRLYEVVKSKRPQAVLSASVWGIYKPLPGCATSQGYGDYFQDSLGWVKAQKIDALVTMSYWDIGSGCTDWSKLLSGFLAGTTGRHLVMGMHALDDEMVQPAKLKARIELARKMGASGTSIFASSYLDKVPVGSSAATAWQTFRPKGAPYEKDAVTPVMPWK